jgi:hypothetical protein
MKRRGETFTLLDESVTFGFVPQLYYYVGRIRQGMKSVGFADSYRTFISIRGKAGEDPFLGRRA